MCLLAVAPLALATPTPTSQTTSQGTSPPDVKVVSVSDLLRNAVEHYQRSEFDAARRQLRDLLSHVGRDKTREAQQVYTYLALVQVAFGKTAAAVATFEKALAIDPHLSLPSSSPKIALVLQQARKRYHDKIRALDHDPPRLHHSPSKTERYGKRVNIAVGVNDQSAIKDVTLNYRTRGNLGWTAVKMERQQRRQYVASIPRLAVARPGIEYYIEAWDALGNGPGLKGSSRAPIRVKVTGGPAPTRTAARPWYRKWWVWTLVGGAALTAAGVTAGALLGRADVGRVDIRLDPALNPAKGKP